MDNILTPAQAKEARSFTGLSQSTVAKEAGVSRTKLALFEVEKYLLEEDLLHLLRAFYEDQGYDFSRPESSGFRSSSPGSSHNHESGSGISQSGYQGSDGCAVPSGLDPQVVKDVLAEIQLLDQNIEELSAEEFKKSWWSDEPDTKKRDLIIRMMARSYCLTRKLEGQDLLQIREDPSTQPNTNGVLVQSLLLEM